MAANVANQLASINLLVDLVLKESKVLPEVREENKANLSRSEELGPESWSMACMIDNTIAERGLNMLCPSAMHAFAAMRLGLSAASCRHHWRSMSKRCFREPCRTLRHRGGSV